MSRVPNRFPRIDEGQFLAAAVEQHRAGRLEDAKNLYRAILTQNPKHTDAMYRMGVMALQVGNPEKAVEFIRKAIKIGPVTTAMYVNLGAALRQTEKFEQALKAYDRVLKLEPNMSEVHYNRGRCLQEMDKLDDAIAAYRKAIDLDPNSPDAWVMLGVVEKMNANFLEATHAFEKALRLNAELGAAYANMGAMLRDRGLTATSQLLYDQLLKYSPDDHENRYRRSEILVQTGQLETGWAEYEIRYKVVKEAMGHRRREPPPYWRGEPLQGKKILLWTEQGLGDEIISMSMVEDLVDRGATCILECSERLVPILARSFPACKICKWRDHFGALEEHQPDYQQCSLSLGQFLRTSFDDFPQRDSYLSADPELSKKTRQRYESLARGRRIIGISWKSSNEGFGIFKTADLFDWHKILKKQDLFFVNLQYGDCDSELEQIKDQLGVEIYQDEQVDSMSSMEEFFAQTAAMDLVISTSNTTVHVSGAIGTPTWLIAKEGAALMPYWFLDRSDSPWYGSMRIFRQQSMPEYNKPWWPEVLDDIAVALDDWLAVPLPARPVS